MSVFRVSYINSNNNTNRISASSLYSIASNFSLLYSTNQLVSASTNTSLGPGDFLVYHSVSLGLHVTCLVLVKGSLDSKGSSLVSDKAQFGFWIMAFCLPQFGLFGHF